GVDGKRDVGKSSLVSKFAEYDFKKGEYKDTLHVYVTTTLIPLNNCTIKVEFLETGWNLRPNKNYIDGAILVYDTSESDGLNEMKEISHEYISSKIPIMIIANKCDINKHENRDDLLKEVKNYFGEECLFDKTSIKEKTSDKLNKILE
ncbi:33854_t:CDS:2, partial [Racocetra persica]